MIEFKPTYLYIKKHSVTGMLYFGKTTRSEKFLLEKYNGSGKHWNHHLKKHGVEYVNTIWHRLFTDKNECVEFATFFSKEFDIIKSKKWANEKNENGIDGGSTGRKGWSPSEKTRKLWKIQRTGRKASVETKQKMSIKRSGKNNYFYGKREKLHPLYGFIHSNEECQRRSLRAKEMMSHPARRKHISDKLSRQWELVNPFGFKLIISNLNQWCKDNNVKYSTVRRQRKGWKCIEVK